jgi:hypothetical protein
LNDPLFLFYEEPDPDRWLPGDRHPRRLIRRLVRGPAQPGGVMRWFLNLRAGLDRLGIQYRLNDYRGLRRSPGAWAHVVGKPHVVEKIPAGHPIVYGPGVGSHPFENDFWDRTDIRLLLLSCDWFKAMHDRDLPRPVRTAVWPAGVDTDLWRPPTVAPPNNRVLVYDKIRWRRDEYESTLLTPIFATLRAAGLDARHVRYGQYREDDYRTLLTQVKAMVFLCEHETQGFAYLQALACGVPILAWDRGGDWQDPEYYPDRVKFSPVTSVPYFDSSCGERFVAPSDFENAFSRFWPNVLAGRYCPREFVTQRFDLSRQAQAYLSLCAAARQTA